MGILTDHFDGENIEIMIFTHIFDHKIVVRNSWLGQTGRPSIENIHVLNWFDFGVCQIDSIAH